MFTSPLETPVHTRKCAFSGQSFVVTNADLELLDAISPVFNGEKKSLPIPKLSPSMRYLMRLVLRNERNFFQRTCSKTGASIVSIHHEHVPFPVYTQEVWWGDDWNALDYGKRFDFDRPFFDQFKELYDVVPQIALNSPRSENSIYTNQSQDLKDCYIVFCSDDSRACMYGMWLGKSHDCVDCSYVMHCSYCYELLGGDQCVSCVYSQGLKNCSDLAYCRDCQGCTSCFGCINLSNKKFHIFNQPVPEDEYQQRIQDLKNDSDMRKKVETFFDTQPSKYYHGYSNEDSFGDYIWNNKSAVHVFNARDNKNIRHCQDVGKEYYSMDLTETLIQDHCISIEGSCDNSNCGFCMKINNVSDVWYSSHIHGGEKIFGCIGLKRANHCLLNTAYSAQEWEETTSRVVDHMCATGEWGEHFPAWISPFAFNDSVAMEYFHMTQKQVEHMGWKWRAEDPITPLETTYTPLPISQYDETIVGKQPAQSNIDACLAGVLVCEQSGKRYKILQQELVFYIQNQIEIPRLHHLTRYKHRMNLRTPRSLGKRICPHCDTEIISPYIATETKPILCEACYQKEVH